MKCENCGNEHDGSYGSGRFCSKHCRCSFNAKKQKNYPTKEQLLKRKGFGRKPKSCGWICLKCGMKFETRAKLRQHNKDAGHLNNQGWAKGLTKQTSIIIANITAKKKEGYKTGRLVPSWKGRHHTEESKALIRKGTVKYLLNVLGSRPRYNKSAIPILEQIAKEHGWNIQHAENGGEFYTGIGYFVDAYDKEKNIVLEYDEPVHYEDIENNILREKDLKRQNEIIEHLHCEYWRYNEKMKLLWKVE